MLTLITVCTVSVHVCMMCVCECVIYIYIFFFFVRAGERDGDRERRGVRCKLKATTACSPDEGVGTMLLFQGRVVSDCDPHPPPPPHPTPSSSVLLSLSPSHPVLVFSLPFHHHRGKSDGAFRLPAVKRTHRV